MLREFAWLGELPAPNVCVGVLFWEFCCGKDRVHPAWCISDQRLLRALHLKPEPPGPPPHMWRTLPAHGRENIFLLNISLFTLLIGEGEKSKEKALATVAACTIGVCRDCRVDYPVFDPGLGPVLTTRWRGMVRMQSSSAEHVVAAVL